MKRGTHSSVQRSLGKKNLCYVLITCDEPTADGRINVEMTYQGDSMLASYLLKGAQISIDRDAERGEMQ